MWSELGFRQIRSPTISPRFHSTNATQGVRCYRGWRRAAGCFHVCQSNGGAGSETSHWYMGDVYWFSNHLNVFVAYTLPSINISYELFSVWSGEKHPSKSLDTSLAFANGHVWRPFSAIGRLWCVCCKGEIIRHSAWKRWMKCVFNSAMPCRRYSGLLLWNFSQTRLHRNGSEQLMMMASCPSMLNIFLDRYKRFRRRS